MRRDAPRDLLGAQPIDEQGQVRPVLLHRAERQDDERALVSREPLRLRPCALGEADHRSAPREARLLKGAVGIRRLLPEQPPVSLGRF
jgi:hypothetical protein